MREFGMISSGIWRSRRFRALPTETAQLAYLYLHTSSHGTSAGAFVLPPEMAALDMKVNSEVLRADFKSLSDAKLIRYDADEELIQIVGFYRFNAISSRKHLAGPLRIVRALPRSSVRDCAACDLVIAMFERIREWTNKIARLRQTGRQADTSDSYKLSDALAGFVEEAAKLVRDFDLAETLCSAEIALSEADRIALSIALSIDLPIYGDGKDHGEDQDHGHNTTTETTTETPLKIDQGSQSVIESIGQCGPCKTKIGYGDCDNCKKIKK